MITDQQKTRLRKSPRLPAAFAAAALLSALHYQGVDRAVAQSAGADAPASSLQIELMLQSGAYDLALRRIDAIQAETPNIGEWLEWENLRYELYQKRGHWDELTDRLLNLPGDVPEINRHELMTRAAELLLESGRSEHVREILRALIWRSGSDSKQLDHWRRLVIRSYLVDDATDDARIAMSLYDQEYLPADADWDYLFAQVLLRQDNPWVAAQRLGDAQRPDARVLRLLSRLWAAADSPQVALSKSAALRNELSGNPSLAAATWAVTAEAALQAGNRTARVNALEQLFNGPGPPPELTLFSLTPADLWRAYEDLGARIGNAESLLFGDPEPWLALARSLTGEGSALRARALTAAVARRSQSAAERGRLHLALYERLQSAGLDTLSVRLYEPGDVFASIDDVPTTIRHRIVAAAIDKRNMKRAAQFARHLAAPGSEQTQIQWDLTRARLALYDGEFDQSESILRSLVLSRDEFDPDTADRVMQPIFDLQSVGRGAAAFELFQYMHERVATAKQQREVLLWMGDAKKSEGEFETAAEHYLRSAYAGSQAKDQWGLSARYHAADALAEAGLFDDARRLYEQLLQEVGEGTQGAALQRRLQELWVKRQARGQAR